MKDQLDLKMEVLNEIYRLLPESDAMKIHHLISELADAIIRDAQDNPYSQLGHSEKLRGAA